MRIDEEFVEEIGLGEMPAEEKAEFIKHAKEELEVRVGQAIGEKMTDEQLAEFEKITDDAEALGWLEQNAPDFREVVKAVYEGFKAELLAEREEILGE